MPKEATPGTYIDKKCPFTVNISIRGRILSGVMTKIKMQRTMSSAGTISITSEGTVTLRSITRPSLCTCPPLSGVYRLVTLELWNRVQAPEQDYSLQYAQGHQD
ncbi:rCG36989 [Rattus norvegicus]|uniref:RCG36989 n=1 Tax=Rattus norvegicus TaxID=10116 RepID=A6HTI5_RAT|nr:rCG36989 [Rattus norvegicus]